MKKLAFILFPLMIAACSNTPKKDNAAASQPETKNAAAASAPTLDQTQGSKLQSQSIYFDYAKSAVARSYHESIQNEALALKGNKSLTITVEGNCDERGSAEYNLGLGQRRADAVKKLLEAAGAPETQIKAVSLGKEKPKLACHDEKCWKENRRVDFLPG